MNTECGFCHAKFFSMEVQRTEGGINICCNKGSVSLPELFDDFPEELQQLFTADEREAKRSNYVYHLAGPLHPDNGEAPSFAQFYIMDSAQAAEERMSNPANVRCDSSTMRKLSDLLSRVNRYAQAYQMMDEVVRAEEALAALEGRSVAPVRMIFDLNADVDRRRYNLPTCNEGWCLHIANVPTDQLIPSVAAVYVGDDIPATRSFAVDEKISAEIPDRAADPDLYALVTTLMIHGACGDRNPNAPCMANGICIRHFPKRFCGETNMNVDSYVEYKRRDQGRRVVSGGFILDNRSVVPFSPFLLKKYQSHVNLEYCAMVQATKYPYKYVHKGSDRAAIELRREDEGLDEIKVTAAESFEDLRTVADDEGRPMVYQTFEEAAKARGLLNDDTEFLHTLQEVATFQMPQELRIICACIQELWREMKTSLSEDFRRSAATDEEAEALAYYEMADAPQQHQIDLEQLIDPPPRPRQSFDVETVDQGATREEGDRLYSTLNSLQKGAADKVFEAADNPTSTRLFFIDGPGGSGKTYFYNALFCTLTGRGKKILPIVEKGTRQQIVNGCIKRFLFAVLV
ncbi:hypothetical protein OESDEN_04280 [Oesophagostomum dentatum]|uniref:Uncharacterized protein n=1 Tax=Oesophagostomum dentatum TaxID=61180 RepID=A0A0B1TDZ7_OESDE|nr:hypothetical protein OESDEN_04280 [Oesophagostomum dentatum]